MSEKNVIRLVYALLILFSIRYLFFIVQIPYTLFFTDYKAKSSFASSVKILKRNAGFLKSEGNVGFISDVEQSKVFDVPSSVKNFYVAQYAIVPSVLRNDYNRKYVVGIFDKSTNLPPSLDVYKKIENRIYLLKNRRSR